MTAAGYDYAIPCLFIHTARADWGVAVLADEANGKRQYLFENGVTRTFATGFYQLMQRVKNPTVDQCRLYAKLCGVLAARNCRGSGRPSDLTVKDQIARFHATFSLGFLDPLWVTDVRGEDVAKRLPHHRQPIIQDAQERLSQQTLDALLENQQFGQVWGQAVTLVVQSGLVSAAKAKRCVAVSEKQRELAVSLRELLYGDAKYEYRFDNFVNVLNGTFGESPQWEFVTAFSALVHPKVHVCVDVTLFRKQLKVINSRRTVGAQPSGAGYDLFLGVTRQVAKVLLEHGEPTRDLFDVRDFIALTLKPAKTTATVILGDAQPPSAQSRRATATGASRSPNAPSIVVEA